MDASFASIKALPRLSRHFLLIKQVIPLELLFLSFPILNFLDLAWIHQNLFLILLLTRELSNRLKLPEVPLVHFAEVFNFHVVVLCQYHFPEKFL